MSDSVADNPIELDFQCITRAEAEICRRYEAREIDGTEMGRLFHLLAQEAESTAEDLDRGLSVQDPAPDMQRIYAERMSPVIERLHVAARALRSRAVPPAPPQRRCGVVSPPVRIRRVHRHARSRRVVRVVRKAAKKSCADPDGSSSEPPGRRASQLGGAS